MRRIALVAAAAMMVAAAPVTAEEAEIVPTQPCEASEDFATLGLDGAAEDVTPSPVPSVGTDIDDLSGDDSIPYHEQSATRFAYRVDLSGSETVPDAATGTVTVNVNWDNDGDYDLYVYDADGTILGESHTFNPLDGPGETVQLGRVAHCTDLTIDIVNYAAPGGPLTAMDLTAKASTLRP